MSAGTGYLGYKGSKAASEGQENAADIAWQMYQQQVAGMAPYAASGASNLARLNYPLYGQSPSSQEMEVNPNSPEYKLYQAEQLGLRPGTYNFDRFMREGKLPDAARGKQFTGTLYKNPLTGEFSTTAPTLNESGYGGVRGGGINPSERFTTADWQVSPEYAAYAGARNAALDRTSADLAAQAGASGMYGSGNVANALAKNVSQIYAGYDPASLAAARDAWTQGRTLEFNQLASLANPNGAQQINTYAGNYGTAAGNAAANQGLIRQQGYQEAANSLSNGLQNAQGIVNMIRSQPTGASTVGGYDYWNSQGYGQQYNDYSNMANSMSDFGD